MGCCCSYDVCDQFDLYEVKKFFEAKYTSQIFKDSLALESLDRLKSIFVFKYGAIVFWGFDQNERVEITEQLRPFMIGTPLSFASEEYSLIKQDDFTIKNDIIPIIDGTLIEKWSYSHALAQSVTLTEFEEKVAQAVEKTKHIPERIATSGKTSLTRKEIAKMRGYLFKVKSEINLKHELLDVPEFFWEFPEVDSCYQRMTTYLEIRQRIEVLNKKLEVIHELFDMLADEQNHQHSAQLEWIIILLITFEVIYNMAKEFILWVSR